MKTGTQLIAEERQRQIEKEGWTKEHDKNHSPGILSITAACYAVNKIKGDFNVEVVLKEYAPELDRDVIQNAFPFSPEDDKREKHSRLKSLVIAGALIAAEIDRELAENSQEKLSQDKSLFCQRNKTN